MPNASSTLSRRLPVGTCLGGIRQVTASAQLAVQAADQHVRHVVVHVLIRVAHVAAVQHQRLIEQRAVAVLRLASCSTRCASILTWYWLILESWRFAADPRRGATRPWNPDVGGLAFRVGAPGEIAGEKQRADARDVGLEGQRQQDRTAA
jgi:hypothetical protein